MLVVLAYNSDVCDDRPTLLSSLFVKLFVHFLVSPSHWNIDKQNTKISDQYSLICDSHALLLLTSEQKHIVGMHRRWNMHAIASGRSEAALPSRTAQSRRTYGHWKTTRSTVTVIVRLLHVVSQWHVRERKMDIGRTRSALRWYIISWFSTLLSSFR